MIALGDVSYCIGEVADAEELAEFAARTFEEAFAADNNPEHVEAHRNATYGPEKQAAELADPAVTSILARMNGELVAYAQVRRNAPPSCVVQAAPIELHRFYVDRPAHGTGLAFELMQQVHEAALGFAGRHLWLGVWEQNPRAIAFYKKAGFVDVGSTVYMVGPDEQIDRVLVARVRQPGAGASSR